MPVNIRFSDQVLKLLQKDQCLIIFGMDRAANLMVFEAALSNRPANVKRHVVDLQNDDFVIFSANQKPANITIRSVPDKEQITPVMRYMIGSDPQSLSTTLLDQQGFIVLLNRLLAGNAQGSQAVFNAQNNRQAAAYLNNWLSEERRFFDAVISHILFLEAADEPQGISAALWKPVVVEHKLHLEPV